MGVSRSAAMSLQSGMNFKAANHRLQRIGQRDVSKTNPRYIAYAVTQLLPRMELMASGGTFKEISKTNFSALEIPLPPLEEQERIVAELEGYRNIVEANRDLIARMEKKIQAKLAEVWGEETIDPITADLKTGDNHG